MSFHSDQQASELLDVFFESAEEVLQGMNGAGLALEANPSDGEQLRHVRRAVHTLKGDSAACGFRELSELAHHLEDALTPELAKENAAEIAAVVLTAADTFQGDAGCLPLERATARRANSARTGRACFSSKPTKASAECLPQRSPVGRNTSVS